MRRIWISMSVVLAATCARSAPASAAEPDAAQSSAFDVALAEADRLFVAGDLQGALDVLEPACAGTDRADCSFSLGAIHHGLGHCSEALANYRRYRAVAPRGEHIEEVRAALEEVEGRCGGVEPAPGASSAGASPHAARTADSSPVTPAADSRSAPHTVQLPRAPPAVHPELMVGAFALSGAAAVTGVVFGILAARSARRCENAMTYDRDYRETCEVDGPRYQGLWQGFAIGSGGFLAVGLTIWWLDARSSASAGVSDAGYPKLGYRLSF